MAIAQAKLQKASGCWGLSHLSKVDENHEEDFRHLDVPCNVKLYDCPSSPDASRRLQFGKTIFWAAASSVLFSTSDTC